jgi:hypothetical protein
VIDPSLLLEPTVLIDQLLWQWGQLLQVLLQELLLLLLRFAIADYVAVLSFDFIQLDFQLYNLRRTLVIFRSFPRELYLSHRFGKSLITDSFTPSNSAN